MASIDRAFTDTELWLIRSTLRERYGEEIPVETGEAEVRLHAEDRTVTPRPVAYWSARGANFVILKLDAGRFRCQFYYRGFEQYGTGRDIYDDLGECVITLLQVQADHERTRSQRGEANPETDRTDGSRDKPSDSEESWKYQPHFWGD